MPPDFPKVVTHTQVLSNLSSDLKALHRQMRARAGHLDMQSEVASWLWPTDDPQKHRRTVDNWLRGVFLPRGTEHALALYDLAAEHGYDAMERRRLQRIAEVQGGEANGCLADEHLDLSILTGRMGEQVQTEDLGAWDDDALEEIQHQLYLIRRRIVAEIQHRTKAFVDELGGDGAPATPSH